MPKFRPSVFLDTETTGLFPGKGKNEMLSLSMLDEDGKSLLKHPKTGEPVSEVKIRPQHIETASPFALDVNGYPGWGRFLDEKMPGKDVTRREHYVGPNEKKPRWKSNKNLIKELEDQWKDFSLNPSEEEAKARKTDTWADALSFDEWSDQVGDILGSHRVVGQNPFFDKRFLEFELDRSGNGQKIGDDIIDTQVLSWLSGMQHQSLGNTTEQLGIELKDAHTAYADTEATRQVYQKLKDPKVLGEIRRNQDPSKGRTRNVMFLGLTTGDGDEVTGMAIVDPQGRTLMNADLKTDEDRTEAIGMFSKLMENAAMGTTDPDRDMALVRQMAKKHGRKTPEGKDIDGWKGGRRFFHSPSLTQIYGVEPKGEGNTALEKAKQQHGMFHEVAEASYGPEGEHRQDVSDFKTWLGNRSIPHPLPKGHAHRRSDYLTWNGLQKLLRNPDPQVVEAGKRTVMGLWRQFSAANSQAQQYRQAALNDPIVKRVTATWLGRCLPES